MAHLDHSRAHGGAELALRRTVLAAEGWTPQVFLPEPLAGRPAGGAGDAEMADGPFGDLLHRGVPVHLAGPPQRAGLSAGTGVTGGLRGTAGLLRVARALRADPAFRGAAVVHANTTRAAVYGALAVDRRRQAFVVHLRDLVTAEGMGRLAHEAMRRWVLGRADAVVANSRATLESARPYLSPGVEQLVLQSPLGLEDPVPVGTVTDEVRAIGMVARLAPWKGQELLVRAFARAFPTGGVRLRLVGAAQFGEDDDVVLRDLAGRLGVAERVDLIGHVEDVAAEIRALDVCVQASLRPEPMGQNVLQYLALGRPTVVAGAGGPLEWVTDGENGLVFTPGSVESLAAALGRLADDHALRARLAAAAAATPGIASDAEVARRLGELFGSLGR